MEPIKIVIIGVSGCGKTLTVFENYKFPEVYVPTKLGTRVVNITIRDEKVKLELRKPFGQTLYDRDERPLTYQDANVIILRYSINDLCSLENIANKWTNELKNECSNALIIPFGNKKDLRNHPETIEGLAQMGQLPVELGEGVVMSEEIGLYAQVECSAIRREGVRQKQPAFALDQTGIRYSTPSNLC